MEKKVERKEDLEVVVTISCEGEEWAKYTKKEYNKAASKVQVKGFRPGHVPANMIKSRVSMAQVLNDALFNAVNDGFSQVVAEGNYNIYTQPALNVTKISEKEFEATVTFALPPVVELGQYKSLGIKAKQVKVLDKDIKEYIDDLRKQHATMKVKTTAAKLGDIVIIDFVGYVDGEAFEGGDAKGYELELGSNAFIPGFEEALVGIKAGEDRTIEVTFPENYVEKLKGKLAKFEVSCSDVKTKVMPNVDAEFITELGIKDVTDEETLKAHCKTKIAERKEEENRNDQLTEIINTAIENATCKIPNQVIEEEVKAMLEQLNGQIKQSGLSFEDYVAISGKTKEELDQARKDDAYKNIKASLVVNKIMNVEGLVVTKEVLDAHYAQIASQYNMSVEDVRKTLEPNKEAVIRQLGNKIFTDFMLANN